jgi:hypothetical protein
MALKNGAKSGSGHGSQRATKLDLFLSLLLVTPNVEEAARQSHISRRTATRWLADRSVAERRRAAARESSQLAMTRLREVMCRAVNRLGELVDQAETENTQVTACKTVLDYALRVAEIEDLQGQISEIKQILKSESRWTNDSTSQYQPPAPRDRAGEEVN